MEFSKKAVELVRRYEAEQGYKTSKKTNTGCDFISRNNRYIEVKSFLKRPRYLQVYSSIFKHLKQTKTGKNRYYIYVVFDQQDPKLVIIPPRRIFKGVDIDKLFSIKLGDHWNKLTVNISPKILDGLSEIKLNKFGN